MTLNHLIERLQPWRFDTLTWSGSTWSGPCMGQIEQITCATNWLMLNCDCYIAIVETIDLCVKKSSRSFVIYKIYIAIVETIDLCVKKSSRSFVIYKMCLQNIYIYILIYMYKEGLALNNLQYAIKPNQTKPNQTDSFEKVCNHKYIFIMFNCIF